MGDKKSVVFRAVNGLGRPRTLATILIIAIVTASIILGALGMRLAWVIEAHRYEEAQSDRATITFLKDLYRTEVERNAKEGKGDKF